jgi:hypothetical protein
VVVVVIDATHAFGIWIALIVHKCYTIPLGLGSPEHVQCFPRSPVENCLRLVFEAVLEVRAEEVGGPQLVEQFACGLFKGQRTVAIVGSSIVFQVLYV